MSPEILAFGSHCSMNFQSILNYFTHGDEHGIPRIKLKESVETGQGQRTNTCKYLGMTLRKKAS